MMDRMLWPLAAILVTSPAFATSNTINDVGALHYTTSSFIVGQTSTSTFVSGGNPIYFANEPQYSGVVTLIMNEGSAGNFLCTGALLADRVSVLTAGHCVSHGAGTPGPVSTTAYFPANIAPDAIVARDPASTAIAISAIRVDPLYTGQVFDQNDIAVLTLSAPAPTTATGYSLYTGNPVGQDYNVAGYGGRSTFGGSVGANLGPGILRQGTNTFDFTFGDPLFQGYFPTRRRGGPGNGGGRSNPAVGFRRRHKRARFELPPGRRVRRRRLAVLQSRTGATEVGTAPGDSGAPDFIDGQIAGITSSA